MSNGFYFVPEPLHDKLQQQAAGDVNAQIEKIVRAFINLPDAASLLLAYQPDNTAKPRAMDGDAFDYPGFWSKVDALGRKVSKNRDNVVAAALHTHFNQAAMLTTLQVPIEKNLYARLRQRALETGMTPHDIITASVERYLAAPAQFERLLTYQKGDTLTIFHYHAKQALVEQLKAALPAHQQPRHRPDARDIVALAIATDFNRQDQAAAAVKAAQARRAQLGIDRRFKL